MGIKKKIKDIYKIFIESKHDFHVALTIIVNQLDDENPEVGII